MELAYTIFLFIFIFNWFYRYNFITFILLISTINIIRNVRLHMVQNKIEETPNPFLQIIKWSGDMLNWFRIKFEYKSEKISERFWIVNWIVSKYQELNNYFLELLVISKKQMINQFSRGFNYTLTAVLIPPSISQQLTPDQIAESETKSIKEKNPIHIPQFSSKIFKASNLARFMILKSAQQTIKVQEDIHKINTIIKELDNKIISTEKIDLYDSDEEPKEKIE